MEEIWRYLIDNWQWSLIVLMLTVLAYMLGSLQELKRMNRWMERHSERLAELWVDEMLVKDMEGGNKSPAQGSRKMLN